MEGTLSATTTLPFFSKPLPCSTIAAAQIRRTQLSVLRSRRITTPANAVFQTSLGCHSPLFERMKCGSSSAASFASSGGGGEVEENPIAGGVDDVIVLDVRGMMCGGCASSVKKILENQSQVSSANVDHTTARAIVWPIPEAKATPNWQKVIGEELATNLTNCGFDSNLRGEAAATGGEP